jgi:DUF4097 and DUF4098 domain-containing protein YvlB
MFSLLVAAALTFAPQQTDTTFAVSPGGSLRLETLSGAVNVTTWDRSEMRIRTLPSSSGTVSIRHRADRVSIDTEARGGRPQAVRFEIVVPRRYNVDVEGVNLGVVVTGVQGTVQVENVEGTIALRDITGNVDVESVSGDITLAAVRGDVTVSTINQAVRLDDVRGSIEAETVNGSIIMRRIDSASVEANTVQGLVDYQGTIRDGGRYYLGTHNGRITLSVPEQANARLSVSTHNGKVETAFPVQMRTFGDGEYALTLGSGSARVELESFNGSVYLVRPGSR